MFCIRFTQERAEGLCAHGLYTTRSHVARRLFHALQASYPSNLLVRQKACVYVCLTSRWRALVAAVSEVAFVEVARVSL